MGKKNKTKRVKRSVRGPQLKLKVNGRALLGRAKGEPGNGRTPRLRYVEPPHKVTGNPFVAVRVPRPLLAGFRKWCKSNNTSMNNAVRAYMAKVTGIKLHSIEEGADE